MAHKDLKTGPCSTWKRPIGENVPHTSSHIKIKTGTTTWRPIGGLSLSLYA